MSNIQILEICVIMFIVLGQIWSIVRTWTLADKFKTVFPSLGQVKYSSIQVPNDDIDFLSPIEVIKNAHMYRKESKPDENQIMMETQAFVVLGYSEDDARTKAVGKLTDQIKKNEKKKSEILFIEVPEEDLHPTMKSIVDAINIYLNRNRASTPDFGLMKDIVERYCDTLDEEINLRLPQPLYLGLMGTMIGVLLGLTNLGEANGTIDANNVTNLLTGVAIAMVASVFGLLGTIINATWKYKNARKMLEKSRNDFFTFIQTEILPTSKRDLSNVFKNLQSNLSKFNDEFSLNIGQLSAAMKQNSDISRQQSEVILKLEKLDIAGMASLNHQTFLRLQSALPHMVQLGQYLQQINGIVGASTLLTTQLSDVLLKTDKFAQFGDRMNETVQLHLKLMKFLESHFSELENRKTLISNTVINVDDILQKGLEELREDIMVKLTAIRNITIKEEDLLETVRSESASNFEKLKYLENINSSFEALKIETASNINAVQDEIKALGGQLTSIADHLGNTQSKGFYYLFINLWGKIMSRNGKDRGQMKDEKMAVTDKEKLTIKL